MTVSIRDESIALAALAQFLELVTSVAEKGSIEPSLLEVPVESILATDPDTTEGVFGGINGIRTGLELLANDILKNQEKRELIQHFLTIIHLEKKVSSNQSLLDQLSQGINQVKGQVEYFSSLTHENIISSLGELYSNTISKLTPRVMIHGNPEVLNNSRTVSTIRMLLLSAIRCAVLWKQSGGSKIKLVFARKRYVEAAKEIIRKEL